MKLAAKGTLFVFTIVVAIAAISVGHAQQSEPGLPVSPSRVAPRIQPDIKAEEVARERAVLAASTTPVTDSTLVNPPVSDWLMWRRTYNVNGYSPLNQITRTNVPRLQTSWAWSVAPNTVEDTPLEHDGVLYIYGANDHMQALDATDGELLWEYDHAGDRSDGQGSVHRNFALYQDKVIFGTDDRHLIALDAKTGKVAWDTLVGDEKIGHFTSGPMVVKGKVIAGTAGCAAGGCPIVALDAATGKELWRFYTVAKTGEPGGDTWNGLPNDQRFGASVWTSGSYDPELNLVYFGTGNTYHWQELMKGNVDPGKRKGSTRDGLYVDSTLALDPDTGKLKWYYQHLPQDYWDLDFAFEQTIAIINVKGKQEKVVCSTGKMVWTDCVDAATGQFVLSQDEGLQNVVKTYDPATGRKVYNEQAIPDLSGQRRDLQCSAGYGDKNWPSGSYDASTNIDYEPLVEVCGESSPTLFGPNVEAYTAGEETRMARYVQSSDGNIGRLDAVNWSTGKIIWSIRQRASITSATVATAGGVIFAGDADRWFRAYDQTDGKVLWKARLNDVIDAYPITYAVKGKQYIAVITGCCGNGRISNMHQLTPEIQQPHPSNSVVWVFALSDDIVK